MRVRVNLLDYLSAISDYQMGCFSVLGSEIRRGEFLRRYGLTEEDMECMRRACCEGRFKVVVGRMWSGV